MASLELFEHYEHGKDADPKFRSLLKEGVKISDITKSIGAEVTGFQLSQLDNKERMNSLSSWHSRRYATLRSLTGNT